VEEEKEKGFSYSKFRKAANEIVEMVMRSNYSLGGDIMSLCTMLMEACGRSPTTLSTTHHASSKKEMESLHQDVVHLTDKLRLVENEAAHWKAEKEKSDLIAIVAKVQAEKEICKLQGDTLLQTHQISASKDALISRMVKEKDERISQLVFEKKEAQLQAQLASKDDQRQILLLRMQNEVLLHHLASLSKGHSTGLEYVASGRGKEVEPLSP
jgi:hypothetical protein